MASEPKVSESTLQALCASADYQTLIKERSKIVWPLSWLMLIVYFAYILVIAFAPDLFGAKTGDGHMTYGMVIGLGVILFSFVLTGIYVHIANTKLEPLAKKILDEAEG